MGASRGVCGFGSSIAITLSAETARSRGPAGLAAKDRTARAEGVVVLVRLVEQVVAVGHHLHVVPAHGAGEAHRRRLARLQELDSLAVGRGTVDEDVHAGLARRAAAGVGQVDEVDLGAARLAGLRLDAGDRQVRQPALLATRAGGALDAADHLALSAQPPELDLHRVGAALLEPGDRLRVPEALDAL